MRKQNIAIIAIVALLAVGLFVYMANKSTNDLTTTTEVSVPVDGTVVDETTVDGTAVEGLSEETVTDTTATDPATGLPTETVTTTEDAVLGTETDAAPATEETPSTDPILAPVPTPSEGSSTEGSAAPATPSTESSATTAPAQSPDLAAIPASTYPIYKHTYGQATAPVTILEFASMSCGHCGQFHKELFADVKAKVLDTGKAKLEFHDYPLNAPAFKAAKLTQCIGAQDASRYEGILQTLFNNQAQWATSADVDAALLQYGRLAGLSEDQYKACQTDVDMENALLKQVQDAQVKYQVDSTPTFIILYNGKMKKISGTQDAAAFEKAIEEIKK